MILLINGGHSSVNVAVYSPDSLERIIEVGVNQLSDNSTTLHFGADLINVIAPDHSSALTRIFDMLFARSFDPAEISAVGHRVPRLGSNLKHPTLITDELETLLEAKAPTESTDALNDLKLIRRARSELPNCPHIAVFDSPNKASLDYDAMAYAVHSVLKALGSPNTIPISVSARHMHLNEETLYALFGQGYALRVDKELSQPNQYAAKETVALIGPRNQFDDVRILGPTRKYNQIEISRSDEYHLGVHVPIRASGDIADTPGIKLAGPRGSVTLHAGVICALRHIHMHPDDAERFAMKDGDFVSVLIEHGQRELTFDDVLVRVSPNYKLEMHIDTDEANAAGLSALDTAVLISTNTQTQLKQ